MSHDDRSPATSEALFPSAQGPEVENGLRARCSERNEDHAHAGAPDQAGVVAGWAQIFVLLLSNAVVGFWEERQAGNEIDALKVRRGAPRGPSIGTISRRMDRGT
jgi:hypothetical protein